MGPPWFRVSIEGWLPATLLALDLGLFAAVAPAAAAPMPEGDWALGAAQLRFTTLTVNDGLPQDSVRALLQDRAGFLWIGTQDGLARYDGRATDVFRHRRDDPNSLGDNNVTALAEDSRGRIWIAHQATGVSRYEPSTQEFQHFSGSEAGLPSPRVQQLLVQGETLWLVTQTGHLVRWDEGSSHFVAAGPATAATLPEISAITAHADGGLWLGSRQGLWRWSSQGQLSREVGGPSGMISALAVGAGGALWIGTAREGAWYRGPAGEVVRVALPGGEDTVPEVLALLVDGRRRVWVGTDRGLMVVDAETHRVLGWLRHDASNRQSLAADRVVSLLETRDGLVWAGTWVAGLSTHDHRTEAFVLLRGFASADGSVGESAPAVVAGADGSFWAAVGLDGGLARLDGRGRILERYRHQPGNPGSLASDYIRTMVRGRDGEIWIGTADAGLDRWRPGRPAFEHFVPRDGDATTLPSLEIRGIHLEENGNLWVGTMGTGIAVRCAGCAGFRRYVHDPGNAASFPEDGATSFLRTRWGELWVGTRAHGVLRLDDPETGRFSPVLGPGGTGGNVSHGAITYLREEPDGTVWAATQGGGLNRISRDASGAIVAITTITSEDGLSADAIGVVLPDRFGKLWASTTRGLSRLDPGSLAIESFEPRHGAQQSYFIGAGDLLADGRIVLGGADGVTLFDPAEVVIESEVVQPMLTEMRVFDQQPGGSGGAAGVLGRTQGVAEAVTLTHRQDAVGFSFTAPAFRNAARLALAYRLDGRNTQWLRAEPDQRTETYSGLGAGSYRFRVRAWTGSLAGAPAETHVDFRVLPAPWATPWAYGAYALLGVSLAAAVTWPMAARLRERRAARAAIERSEQRLKLALWGSGDELWELDLAAQTLRRDHCLPGLPGADSVTASLASFTDHIHEADREEYASRVEAVRAAVTDTLEHAFRVRAEDGEWRWLQARGRVVAVGEGPTRSLAGTHQDITAWKLTEERQGELQEELRHQAFHDPLTGTANRALFSEQLRIALSARGASSRRPAVVFVDLDEFKLLNDSLGHPVGDRLLCAVAERLLGLMPTSEGTVARLGGDEFALLIEHASKEQVFVWADRVMAAFREPFMAAEQRLHVTASIGVAFAAREQSADDLLRNADLAMFRSKSAGRNRVEVYSPEMHGEFARRLNIIAALRWAIEAAAVEVHFQPIVELATGRWVGAEALARLPFDDPELSSPAAFIPIAEEAGLIEALGELILRRALADAQVWAGEEGAAFFVSVNVSPRQLQYASLAGAVEAALAASKWPGERLVLEFTESSLMTVTEVSRTNLSRLRALGVRLALDDFGTGYSSLAQLGRERFDLLKIAKPFVDGLPGLADSVHMAEAIVRMADSLGMSAIAEGVEHAAQADALRRVGCSYAQGFVFGRPLPARELAKAVPGAVTDVRL
jgi:diguanylate cyclase (GGDEF)-like protein